MDSRTRACVRRMELEDIASLPEHVYRRALVAFDNPQGRPATLNVIYGLRLRLIQDGLHPVYGTRWKEEEG